MGDLLVEALPAVDDAERVEGVDDLLEHVRLVVEDTDDVVP